MLTKKTVAVKLSKLKSFEKPNMELEQYTTESDIAAELIHNAALRGDIIDKQILDLGAGTGTLGIAALLFDAEEVTFIEVDGDAMRNLKANLEGLGLEDRAMMIHGGIMPLQVDTVIMNPPFGTKKRHADKEFLLVAMKSAPVIYSVHLASSEAFLRELAADHGYSLDVVWPAVLRLPPTHPLHTKKSVSVPVVLVRLVRS